MTRRRKEFSHCNEPLLFAEAHLLYATAREKKEFRDYSGDIRGDLSMLKLHVGRCEAKGCQSPEVLAWEGLNCFQQVIKPLEKIPAGEHWKWFQRIRTDARDRVSQLDPARHSRKEMFMVKASRKVIPHDVHLVMAQ